MADLFDTSGKKAVRETWNSPILVYLNQKYGFKYRYMGLPGADLLDVRLWQNMIEEVIAFELATEPSREDPDGRQQIVKLRRNMQIRQIPGYVYCGPMEDVILRGEDFDGQKFTNDKLITLYNLDFCDEISSTVLTKNKGEQLLRFQSINRILTDHHRIFQKNPEHNYFLLLLTVRNQIDAARLRTYLTSGLLDESWDHLEKCGGVNALPRTGPCLGTVTWAMKTFIYNFLRQSFYAPRISSLFFPIVKYSGNPKACLSSRPLGSPMLHCMVFCRFHDDSPQTYPKDFLNVAPCLFADTPQHLVWAPEPAEPDLKSIKNPPDSLEWFKSYESHFLNGII